VFLPFVVAWNCQFPSHFAVVLESLFPPPGGIVRYELLFMGFKVIPPLLPLDAGAGRLIRVSHLVGFPPVFLLLAFHRPKKDSIFLSLKLFFGQCHDGTTGLCQRCSLSPVFPFPPPLFVRSLVLCNPSPPQPGTVLEPNVPALCLCRFFTPPLVSWARLFFALFPALGFFSCFL